MIGVLPAYFTLILHRGCFAKRIIFLRVLLSRKRQIYGIFLCNVFEYTLLSLFLFNLRVLLENIALRLHQFFDICLVVAQYEDSHPLTQSPH